MHRALAWLADANAARPVTARLLPGPLLLRAAILALGHVPELNACRHGARVTPADGMHVGVGVPLRGGGLVTPTVHDADSLGVDALMATLRDLVARARAGSLRAEELTGATVTITSLGEQGVESIFPAVVPPQVAAIGFGTIVERPLSLGGEIVAGPVCMASLTVDAEAADGHRGARFLTAVARYLQQPETL
jgi:pyruvate dehydrogenase E2 component (dihydrolipoamide acetyltransferase)